MRTFIAACGVLTLAYHAVFAFAAVIYAWADRSLGLEDALHVWTWLPQVLLFHMSNHRIGWAPVEPSVIALSGLYWIFLLWSVRYLFVQRRRRNCP